MRITMFVFDDVKHDTRVRREAVALAAAGHQVTIVGRASDLRTTEVTEDRLDDIVVLRVPIPNGWRRPWRILGAPVRLSARVLARSSICGMNSRARTIGPATTCGKNER